MKNILTVDLEDWYQTESYKTRISFSDWGLMESQIRENTTEILRMLKECGTKATFFVVGYNIKRHSELIKFIAKEGHELGLHGYCHDLVYRQTPAKFKEEMEYSKKMLEDTLGNKIIGFRAPGWSIRVRSLWALDILFQLGFSYDSSMDECAFRKFKYKIPDGMREIPRSSFSFLTRSIPFGGGFFLRAYPYFVTKSLINTKNIKNVQAVVYIHPWEIKKNYSGIRLSFYREIISNFSFGNTADKLSSLLRDFKFDSIKNIFYAN